jgi:hypothetical protein
VYNKRDTISGGFNYGKKKVRNKTTDNSRNGHSKKSLRTSMAGLVFFTDDALFKMPYLAMKDITKKWTGRRQDLRSAERCLHL